MGSKKGSTESTSRNDPPAYLSPFLENAAEQSWWLHNLRKEQGIPTYPDSTVVPFAAETQSALQRANELSQNNPGLQAAVGENQATVQGDYLGANPQLDAMYNRGFSQMQRGVRGAFAGGNRSGSGAEANALADGGAQLAENIYGANFENERRRMVQGQALAPQLSEQQFRNIGEQGEVGATRENMSAAELEDAMMRWRNSPEGLSQDVALDNFIARLSNNPLSNYGTVTQSTPYTRNRTSGAIGGGLSGAATGAMIGSVVPGIGTGIGALVGGGLGALGGGFG